MLLLAHNWFQVSHACKVLSCASLANIFQYNTPVCRGRPKGFLKLFLVTHGNKSTRTAPVLDGADNDRRYHPKTSTLKEDEATFCHSVNACVHVWLRACVRVRMCCLCLHWLRKSVFKALVFMSVSLRRAN